VGGGGNGEVNNGVLLMQNGRPTGAPYERKSFAAGYSVSEGTNHGFNSKRLKLGVVYSYS
jgi:hypothetical protein